MSACTGKTLGVQTSFASRHSTRDTRRKHPGGSSPCHSMLPCADTRAVTGQPAEPWVVEWVTGRCTIRYVSLILSHKEKEIED